MPLNDFTKFAREIASEFGIEIDETEKQPRNDNSGQRGQRSLNSVLREISEAINTPTTGGKGSARPAAPKSAPGNKKAVTELNAQIDELKRRQRRLEAENRRLRESATGSSARVLSTGGINLHGVKLDSQSAHNAIILSEIIGPPLAKRSGGEGALPFLK